MFCKVCLRFCRGFSSSPAGKKACGGGYDVIIAGGGIMGCSSAFFLAQRVSPSSICIIERDPTVGKKPL